MTATNFFPSKTVALYMARLFLTRTLGIAAGLVIVLLTLNLLSESGKILAVHGNGQAEVWRYVSLRGPQLVQFAIPYSVLLGTILTLMQMNQNSEVIALKAAGLSAHQVLAPLLIASMGVAIFSFAFNDRFVSRATATLNQWQHVDYGPLPIDHGDRTNVWVQNGEDLIEVNRVRGSGDRAQLDDVSVYDREGNTLVAIWRAPHGVRDGDGWRVGPTQRFDVASGRVTQLGAVVIGHGVRPDQLTLANVDADGMSFLELRRAIGDLRDSGQVNHAHQLEGAMWHKLSGPLSAVLMPLLGAVAAFGIARSGKLFIRAVIGMALGFAYFVADNFALAMGNIGAYSPFLAAWAPILLFFLIGEEVLVRTEE